MAQAPHSLAAQRAYFPGAQDSPVRANFQGNRSPDPGGGKSEKTISMWRLRRILGLAIVLWGLRSFSAGAAHFLHAFPLFRRNHHHRFWLEHIVGHSTAHHHVIARLNVRHGDAVAAFMQRSLFIQLDSLCDVVRPENRQLGRVDRFHFAENIILAEFALGPAARTSSLTAALTACAATARTTPEAAARALTNHLRVPGVIRVFLATHKHCVSDFEIAELRRLALFAKLRVTADLYGYDAPVLPRDLEGLIVNRR